MAFWNRNKSLGYLPVVLASIPQWDRDSRCGNLPAGLAFAYDSAKNAKRSRQADLRRGYDAAAHDRLVSDWNVTNQSPTEELRISLRRIRARSRDLAKNDDHVKAFLRLISSNVVGPLGVMLQSKVRLDDGTLDNRANQAVEDSWKRWAMPKQASVTKRLSWVELQRIIIKSIARDGEVLVRKVKGFDNSFRFSLQVMEADFLDEDLNKTMPNGNKVIMGVEVNEWWQPVNYHLFTAHPGDVLFGSRTRDHQIIPAEEMLHLYIQERPQQVRGVPWAHTAARRLKMLGAYEEAEVVASRIAAAKAFAITSPSGELPPPDKTDANNNPVTEVEPGMVWRLPEGASIESLDPQHPNSNVSAYITSELKGVASGLGVSHPSLTSDLAGVNFSSIRAGLLQERDYGMELQEWFISHNHQDIFEKWLEVALLTNQIQGFTILDFDRLNAAHWQGRRWPWVDPLKDVQANSLAVKDGFKSRSQVIRENGRDPEDVFNEIEAENERLGDLLEPGSTATGTNEEESDDGEDGEDGENGRTIQIA